MRKRGRSLLDGEGMVQRGTSRMEAGWYQVRRRGHRRVGVNWRGVDRLMKAREKAGGRVEGCGRLLRLLWRV